jgi:hypothetical protein
VVVGPRWGTVRLRPPSPSAYSPARRPLMTRQSSSVEAALAETSTRPSRNSHQTMLALPAVTLTLASVTPPVSTRPESTAAVGRTGACLNI